MEKALFTAVAEIIEQPNTDEKAHNPFLTLAKFVFADDKGAPLSTAPAGLLQGIELEDFDTVIASSIDMPVKMNFSDEIVGNHTGSYVIGHITKMEKVLAEDSNKLVATAVLYADEYPKEVKALKESYAEGKAPGISYEIAYADSIIKNGVQWIKDVITCAATFVRSPAYGSRTALLALASAKNDSEFNEVLKSLAAQAEEDKGIPTPSHKGGNNVDELEKAQAEIERIKAEAQTKTAEIAALTEQITEKDNTITSLQETIATLERNNAVAERTRKFTEAGFTLEADAEKADKKKAFWLTLSDEAFEEYLGDLVAAKAMAAKPENRANASARTTAVPKLEVPANEGTLPSFNFRD